MCSTLSHKPYDVRKKVTEHKMCLFDFLYKFAGKISNSQRIVRDIIINVHRPSRIPVILVRF